MMVPRNHKLNTLALLARLVRLLADYDPTDDYWHGRIFLEPLTATRWVFCTAHFDPYDEEFGDAMDLRPVGPRGGINQLGLTGRVLRIGMDEFARRQPELERAARRCAEKIRRDEGLPEPDHPAVPLADAGAPGGDAAIAAPGGVAPAPGAGAGRVDICPPAPAAVAGDVVVVENRAGYQVGDVIRNVKPQVLAGDRGVLELSDGSVLAIGLVGTVSTPTPRAPEDIRTLPVELDQVGERSRPFSEAVRKMTLELIPGWHIIEPHTCQWLLLQW